MDTAKIFKSGLSQAVRLPKEYRFSGSKINIKKIGNSVLLMPVNQPWEILPTALSLFKPRFQLERAQPEK